MLCERLQCGKTFKVYQMNWPKGDEYNKMMMKCSDHKHLDHLWQCASPLEPGQQCLKRAAVTCTGINPIVAVARLGTFFLIFL